MTVGDMVNKLLVSKYTKRIIYGLLGGALITTVMAFYMSTTDWLELVKIGLTPVVIFCSLLITARQFAYNREWNKKDAANKSLRDFLINYNKIIEDLHDIINIRDYIRNKRRLSVAEIHNVMGAFVKKTDGKHKFVYHGKESQEDIKNIQSTHSPKYNSTFKDGIDGMKIERSIISLLGEFEYISSSIDNDIFDEKIVVDLLGSTIVYTYFVFEFYIKHQRHGLRHGGDRDILYVKFENFAKRIDSNNSFVKVEKRDYLVPFEDQ